MRRHLFPYHILRLIRDYDFSIGELIEKGLICENEPFHNTDDLPLFWQNFYLRAMYPLLPGMYFITLTNFSNAPGIIPEFICFIYLALQGISIYRDTYKQIGILPGYIFTWLIPFSYLNYILRV